jgi:uncharacterized Tic20 family protein
MQGVLVAILAFIALMGSLIATPLDDYVWRKDEAYGWVDMVQTNKLNLYVSITTKSGVE